MRSPSQMRLPPQTLRVIPTPRSFIFRFAQG